MPPTRARQRPEDRGPAAATFPDEQLFMVAEMYYGSDMSQAEIARTLGVSQPHVSRMLELTRRRGIVRISIAEFEPRERRLETMLKSRLGLRSVTVIRSEAGSAEQARQTLAHFGAPVLSRLVESARTTAVAGGRTLCAIARKMKPTGTHEGPEVLQAMGCIGAIPEPWDSLEIGRTIAGKWQTPFLMLNTPAFFPSAKTCAAMAQLPQIRSVLDRLREAHLALVGVGTLENSIFLERKALDQSALSALLRAGAVGEICGRYFNARGEECRHPLRDCVAGMELDWLRKMRNVVAVVVGEDRAAAVLSAVRGGIVKSIITDSALAIRLLDMAGTKDQAK
jgi:deoxyribonucleoside regulator